MFNLGMPELILILVVGLVVFGPKKLPEIGRSVGKGLREFKKAMNDIKQTIDIDSEFKEVAEIRKEVTEIKTGLKEVVLGSETPSNSQIPVTSAENEAEEAESVEDPKLSWINNSTEWTMPEWVESTDTEDVEMETTGKIETAEKEALGAPEQKPVTPEKVQLAANEKQTTGA